MGVRSTRVRSVSSTLSLVGLFAVSILAPAPVAAARPADLPAPAADTARAARDRIAPATSVLVHYRDDASVIAQGRARVAAGVSHDRGRPADRLEVVRPARGQTVDEAVAALRADPAVLNAEPNSHLVLAADPQAEEYWPLQWGLENEGGDCINVGFDCTTDVDIDALRAWHTSTGAGVTVAVLDDGVDFAHPELAGQAWMNPGETGLDGLNHDKATNGVDDDGNGYVDDVNGVNLCADATTQTLHVDGVDWHGTSVAATIAASVDGAGVVGVAPDARIMGVRWLIEGECDTIFDAIPAISYAIAKGADVINASWGSYDGSTELRTKIQEANAAGILFVAAAGNEGTYDHFYPAAYDEPNVISVAANDPNGYLADFSNRGSTVDLTAPGVAIALPCISWDSSYCPDVYSFVDGTSFAAPHVAGVAALVLAVRPDLKNDAAALRAKLIDSGTKSPKLDGGVTGSGRRLNAGYAVDVTPPSAPSVRVRASADSTIGATSTSMAIVWPASTDASGIDAYRVRYRVTGSSTWTTIATWTSAQSARVTLAYGRSYDVQVTARDRGGNSTSTTVTTTPKLYSESSTHATYAGSWSLARSSSYSGGKARATGTAGRSVTYSFTGRSAAWVAAKGPTRGSAKVYVDGTYVTTVSLYASSTSYRRVVWTTSWSASGSHTVRIVVKGTSGHPGVNVDAVITAR